MEKLSDLPNIGKVVETQLNNVGIYSYDELKDIGAEEAWLKIFAIDDSACMNRLLGLEGAVNLVKKAEIPELRKLELKEFYNNVKK